MNLLQQLCKNHPDKFMSILLNCSVVYHVNGLKAFAYTIDDGSICIQDIDDGCRNLQLNEFGGKNQLTYFGVDTIRKLHTDSYEELEKIALEYDEKVNRALKRLVKEKRIKMIEEL